MKGGVVRFGSCCQRIPPLSLALSHQGRGDISSPPFDGRGWGRVQDSGFKPERQDAKTKPDNADLI